MTDDTGASARPASGRRGRHRTPGAPPPWFSMARVVLAVIGVIVALWLALTLVSRLVGGGADNPGSAPPNAGDGTSAGPTGSSAPETPAPTTTPGAPTTPAPTTSAAPSADQWTPAKLASELAASFDAEVAAGAEGALVVAGKFGDNVLNAPVTVEGEWGAGRLRNGLTVAQNHEQALRAGKLTAKSALPKATTVAKVAVTKTDVRSLPVQSARDAFTALTNSGAPDCAECQDIIIAGVKAGTTRVATTRGPVLVPAWSYEVQGTKARIVVPALAPTALLDPAPPYRGKAPSRVVEGQLPLWRTALSADGRIFTAFVDTAEVRKRGGCWQLFAVESKTSVAVYAARGAGEAAAPCASSTGKVTVRLAAPLGARTLLDTYWTRAIAP